MITIGVVGHVPLRPAEPVRGGRFDRLQRILGSLESAPADAYPALHAACHALMNGIDRVVISSPRADEPAAWAAALHRLLAVDSYPVVVAPGGPSESLIAEFCTVAHTKTSCLWVDDGASDVDGRWRAVAQGVPTCSPGRTRMERLPGSALVAPLHLARVSSLRGIHGRPDPPGLLTMGASGRIGLSRPLPWPGLPPAQPSGTGLLESRIAAALEALAEPLVLTETVTSGLFRRLEREAGVVMERFRRAGELTDFRVRCDQATRQDAPGPVIEVSWSQPKRVQRVSLRVGLAASER